MNALIRRVLHRLGYLLWTPIRLFRQRTMVQLMVSHVAVVLLTFLLLNLIVLAVIVGWLPGRSVLGFDLASQDMFLGERARSYANWIDLDRIGVDGNNLNSPAARGELTELLEMVVNNEVPGFEDYPDQNPASSGIVAFGVPEHATLLTPDGTYLTSTRPRSDDVINRVPDLGPGVREAVESVVAQSNAPLVPGYTMTMDGDVTAAAAPIFDRSGDVIAILALQGFPVTEIFEQAGPEIIQETALGLIRTTWVYMIPAILVALPFAYWQSRSTSRRLERLADLADAFADGDLHTRVRVARYDEIGRLAERFNEMGGRIEEEERLRRAFLSNVSHELRTPVAIIQGTVERIRNRKTTSKKELDQAIALVDMETHNLTRLIDDLSTLGRLQEARLRLDLHPLDVYALVDDAVKGLRQMAWNQRKITIENLVPDDLPYGFADAGRLRQIVHNLLFNAMRHTPEGGLVVVQGSSSGTMMELVVSDTGVGIPQDKLERIFTRYYQAEIHKRGREGSGLGLHIVQQLVEAQGGTISVESEVGKGTTFRFTFPISAKSPNRQQRPTDTGSV